MKVNRIVAQLRTTDVEASIRFYIERLGFTLAFRYGDFYAGVGAGDALIHLKLIDAPDPSVTFVAAGGHLHLYLEVEDAAAAASEIEARGTTLTVPLHHTDWGTTEFAVADDQGHVIYFGHPVAGSR